MADVKHRRFDKSASKRHVFDLGHSLSMDWQQSKVLEFECDFHKRRFIESYYINTLDKERRIPAVGASTEDVDIN